MIICAAAVTIGFLLFYHAYMLDPSSALCTIGVILWSVGLAAGMIIESEQRDKNKKLMADLDKLTERVRELENEKEVED